MQTQALKAQSRKVLGRKVKQLRREGVLPANIFGKKVKSQAIQVMLADFEKIFAKVGETGIVELAIDGDKRPVLIHNVQKDPVEDTVIHADFLQVDLKEKVSAQVPVELTGESPAEKEGRGTVVQYIDEIEVQALPTNLPERFELDLSRLNEVDQIIKVADISVDREKVEVQGDPEQIIAKVEPPRKLEEALPEEEERVEEEEEAAAEERAKEETEARFVGEKKEEKGKEKQKAQPSETKKA